MHTQAGDDMDWEGFHDVFENTNAPSAPNMPSADDETVIFNGEEMPRWLALDLADERAAIMEDGEGMSQEEAEGYAFRGLKFN